MFTNVITVVIYFSIQKYTHENASFNQQHLLAAYRKNITWMRYNSISVF